LREHKFTYLLTDNAVFMYVRVRVRISARWCERTYERGGGYDVHSA